MKTQRRWLILVVVLLAAAMLSCGLFGGGGDTSEAGPVSPSPAAGESQPAESAQPAGSQADLGDEYRSEVGGYAFRVVPGYAVEEAFGFTSMSAPDTDPEVGPTFLLIGGANDEPVTTEDLFTRFLEEADTKITVVEQREITVDGHPGILAEVEGPDDSGGTVHMRVVVVAVSDTQSFSMVAIAPADRWGEIAAQFDPVLASVSFFEPQAMNLEDLGGLVAETPEATPDGTATGDTGDAGNSGDSNFSDLGDLDNFPSQAGDLPPGGFAVLLANPDGTMVLVSGEQAAPQANADEYVVALSGMNPENSLTLFLPHDLATDMLIMVPYDPNASTHASGVTIQIGPARYTSTDGIIMVEGTDGKTISGSMFFTAVGENGDELSVSGFFNALPLTP